jgi:hypothetical protein
MKIKQMNDRRRAATGKDKGQRVMKPDERTTELKRASKTESALATLPRLPGKVTRTSWMPPANLTYDAWLDAGRKILDVSIASQWWLVDWWNANPAYGERVEAAKEFLPIDIGTLRAYASAAANVCIRVNTLSFTHHRVVASLVPDQQRFWLERAEREGLSVRALDAAIKQHKGIGSDHTLASATEHEAHEQNEHEQELETPPPPPLPPLPPVQRVDRDRALLATFNTNAGGLFGLLREPPRIFAGTHVPPSQLRMVAEFLKRVAAEVDGTAAV